VAFAAVSALVVLWVHRRSVLDQWLIVVALASTCELGVAALTSARFTAGFYGARIFSLVVSTTVLAVLLAETTRLYARLVRSNTMLQHERNNKLISMEAMAASISHEMRQPLATITVNGETALLFLEQTPPDLEGVRSSLNMMVSDSHRAGHALDSIRSLLGKGNSIQEPIDVNGVVAESLRALSRELTDNEITTRVELTEDLPLVTGNKGQLNEVIINLIRNATEAMDEVNDDRRVLQVRTGHQEDAVTVAVEDSGPGIDPDKADRLFDAFVTTKPEGMGLGLAICRLIIERHGGQISVSAAHPHGALFRIVLPRTVLPH
jgi:signal transduction histidine kinase